jgi:hypothetical protein
VSDTRFMLISTEIRALPIFVLILLHMRSTGNVSKHNMNVRVVTQYDWPSLRHLNRRRLNFGLGGGGELGRRRRNGGDQAVRLRCSDKGRLKTRWKFGKWTVGSTMQKSSSWAFGLFCVSGAALWKEKITLGGEKFWSFYFGDVHEDHIVKLDFGYQLSICSKTEENHGWT